VEASVDGRSFTGRSKGPLSFLSPPSYRLDGANERAYAQVMAAMEIQRAEGLGVPSYIVDGVSVQYEGLLTWFARNRIVFR
jgi:hypothetical protein